MKKILGSIVLSFICLFVVTGCTTYKTIEFKVETGDKIAVKVRTNDKYDITAKAPFIITKDNETISQGTFITLDGYDQYLEVVKNDPNAKIIEEKEKGNLEYIFYSYNDSEYNYIIKIKNSSTGVILANNVSKETAEACFKKLTFTKK